ncbi:MAG: hypothetical protein JSV49_05705 [Thermoplasmata archaeon]|nr:MAG: hypothetical protein JSV49_05705 [Thermoplasmata archaeon]
MKKYIFPVILILTCFLSCLDDTDNYSTYFPLKVGNTWYYDYPTPQTNPWAMKTIKSSLINNNTVYYEWRYGEGVDLVDWIRRDEQGNIWNLKNNNEYLWFAFTLDNGSTYIYCYPDTFGHEIYYYNVSVRRNKSAEVPAGVFDDCIILFFDIPQVKDEEKIYTFAPNIGLVRLQHTGWSTKRLTSAIIDGVTIGN